jgi:peptide/nickel transport system permease protein
LNKLLLLRLKFIGIKLLWALLTLFAIALVSFLLFDVFQDSTIMHACGKPCTPEKYETARHFLGLDKGIFAQFGDFVSGLFNGRRYGGEQSTAAAIICAAPCLGYSLQLNQNVTDLILARVEVTLSIAIVASIIWLLLGVTQGIIAAKHRGKWIDRVIQAFSVVSISAPVYLVGLVLLAIFGFSLHIFPTNGYVQFLRNPVDWLYHLLLPCLILGISHSVIYTKMTRSGLLDAYASDYYRTFTALGVSRSKLFWKYGMRTTLVPLVTVFGLNFGGILSGAIITETVFGLPGLGKLFITAAQTHDSATSLGCILLSSVFILVANFVVDAIYIFLDPKISQGLTDAGGEQ